jgi:hypothetical protein
MPSPSNIYAEKVFAEHPTALWALDDQADFVSLISETDRDLSSWTISIDGIELTELQKNELVGISLNDVNEPMSGLTGVYSINGLVSSEEYSEIMMISPQSFGGSSEGIQFSSLNRSMGTFSIGAYVKSQNSNLFSFSIGYRYFDSVADEYRFIFEDFKTPVSDQWILGSKTFEILPENSRIDIVIKLKYIGGSISQDDYKFFIHGLSIGQWSEEFLSESIGVTKESIPYSIMGDASHYGVKAQAYGISDSDGWYLVKDNALVAKNSSIPMTYGASSTTILYPNGDSPSIILPGQNFLNEVGQYKDFTFETWLRIISSSPTPKRIFGNIRGTDGLYVDGPFLVWKYGNYSMSYQVSEWGKPMLLQVSIIKDSMMMLIDGEQVATVSTFDSGITLPKATSKDSAGIVLDNNWLGFWAHDDVTPIEIDAVAIYPYRVPEAVAKRRFVYGQAVEVPENINTAYSGTSIIADFAYAEYSNSFMYPDLGKWESSISDNVVTKDKALSVPTYSLPTFEFSSGTYDEWILANKDVQNEDSAFFSLKPTGWSSDGYGFVDNLFLGNQPVSAIYGIFKIKTVNQQQCLFVIEDKLTKNSLSVELFGTDVVYNIKYGSYVSEIARSVGFAGDFAGEKVAVGISLNSLANYFGGPTAKLLGNRSNLSLYIGGNRDGDKTFTGNIYSVGLCSSRNYSKIADLFSVTGILKQFENVFDDVVTDTYDAGDSYFGNNGGYYDIDGNLVPLGLEFWQYYIDGGNPSSFASLRLDTHVATNTIFANDYIDTYSIDSMTDSYWQDYIPLSSLAKYVYLPNGDKQYALDFVQINIGYPAPAKFAVSETAGEWSYADLQLEYATPTQRTYDTLANPLITGFDTYEELAAKAQKEYFYDTSDSLAKTFVSFQYLNSASGPSATDISFNSVIPANKNGVIKPGADWMTTLYEVVDNMVIYMPADVDINDIALVTHVAIQSNGIRNNPVKIRYIKYASQALNYKAPNPVGTRFGTQIFPYTKVGSYFDYKKENPFAIYRESTPYLYLTRNSGIKILGDFNRKVSRGISVPINRQSANAFKVLAIQAAVRYDEDFFPYSPTEVFTLNANSQGLKFFIQAIDPSGKRARIYADNSQTGDQSESAIFYINGRLTKEAVITIKEWSMLGIAFPSLIDFSLNPGSFTISGPLTTNVISYYQSTSLQEVLFIQRRAWISVKRTPTQDLDWAFWTSAYIWENVLVIASSNYYGIDPSKVYDTYTGTNKILVDDDVKTSIGKYSYFLYKDLKWRSETVSAV